MVGCSCPVCRSSDPRDRRTRSSLLIRHDGRVVLIDTSTDLRTQALAEQLERIDAVLFTHSHADHVNGIDDLRGFHFLHKDLIPCYASPETLETLQNGFGYIFEERPESGYTPLLVPHQVKGSFQLFGLDITPVLLDHGRTTACGYRIGRFAYLTDCSGIPESSIPLLQNLDILVIDGLRWKSHPSHLNIDGALAVAAMLKPQRTVLTHLTHDVCYADTSRLPHGVEFAYDGLHFEIALTTQENGHA